MAWMDHWPKAWTDRWEWVACMDVNVASAAVEMKQQAAVTAAIAVVEIAWVAKAAEVGRIREAGRVSLGPLPLVLPGPLVQSHRLVQVHCRRSRLYRRPWPHLYG